MTRSRGKTVLVACVALFLAGPVSGDGQPPCPEEAVENGNREPTTDEKIEELRCWRRQPGPGGGRNMRINLLEFELIDRARELCPSTESIQLLDTLLEDVEEAAEDETSDSDAKKEDAASAEQLREALVSMLKELANAEDGTSSGSTAAEGVEASATQFREAVQTILAEAASEASDRRTVSEKVAASAERVETALEPVLTELEKIEEAIGIPLCKKRLYDDWRSYNGWGFSFTGGAEWVTVSDIFQESLPLVDLVVYRDFRTKKRWRWMPQLLIDAQLTNAGEALAALDPPPMNGNGDGETNGTDGDEDGGTDGTGDTTGDDGDGSDGDGGDGDGDGDGDEPEVESALNFNFGFFIPFARFEINNDSLRDKLGFLIEAGFRDIDSQDEIDERFYGGFRLAFNPEWYVDLLYGKTDSLESDRLEIRGQFPVTNISKNSRVYLGLIANIGVDKPAGVDEEDVVRVYANWNVDVRRFFQGLRRR